MSACAQFGRSNLISENVRPLASLRRAHAATRVGVSSRLADSPLFAAIRLSRQRAALNDSTPSDTNNKLSKVRSLLGLLCLYIVFVQNNINNPSYVLIHIYNDDKNRE